MINQKLYNHAWKYIELMRLELKNIKHLIYTGISTENMIPVSIVLYM